MKKRGIILCDCKHERADMKRLACPSCGAKLVVVYINRVPWALTKFDYAMTKYFIDKAIMEGKERVTVKT